MSIFRTIKKVRYCDTCMGTGKILNETCHDCNGSGHVEVLSRVSQAAAARASSAAKELPPKLRAAVKERLQDHEPSKKDLPKGAKESKVGAEFIEED